MPVNSVDSATSLTPPSNMLSSRSDALGEADFLLLLTQQLKSQDPLNPMDGQDFATQLATFTQVQELQGISATLDNSLNADLMLAASISNTMAASLIGKQVRADASTVAMDSTGTAQISYELGTAATDISIEIQDSDGNVVRTLTVPAQAAGSQSVEWDGLSSDGTHVAAGSYKFVVNAKDADGKSVTATTYIEGVVKEIRYEDGNAMLIVNGREISLGDVISVSSPKDEG